MCNVCQYADHEINEHLASRLMNYKFRSATMYMQNEPEEVKGLVTALAALFGNVGWFDGGLSIIVDACLSALDLTPEKIK